LGTNAEEMNVSGKMIVKPYRPRRPKTMPGPTLRSTPPSATTSPYDSRSARVSMAGVAFMNASP
jgi:hypothetical protein